MTLSPPYLHEALMRRYAVKHFDPTQKLSDEQIDILLGSLRLSPSSYGLQGRGFVVVKNEAIRQELLAASYDQAQVVDASHLLVLCRRTDVDAAYVEKYMQDIATTRQIDRQKLDGYAQMINGTVSKLSPAQLDQWLDKQVYIAQGFLLSACALLGIDACPMEGFVAEAYDRILELEKLHLASCIVVPVGYRAAYDAHATMPKVRFPAQEVIFTI